MSNEHFQLGRSRALGLRATGWRFRRRACLAAILLSLTLGLAMAGVAAAQSPDAGQTGQLAVVGAQGAVLFSETDGAPVAQLSPGVLVTLQARSADAPWLFLTTEAGATGWARTDRIIAVNISALPTAQLAVTPDEAAARPTARAARADAQGAAVPDAPPAVTQAQAQVNTPSQVAPITARVALTDARLNVRSGPGTGYAVVDKLLPGARTALVTRTGDGAWVEVQAEDGAMLGWVNSVFLAPSGAIDELPVTAGAPAPVEIAADTVRAASGLTGKLVLQTGVDGPIYLYMFDTGRLTRLTYGTDPALSPDGRYVAFTRGGGENGLYVLEINADGSGGEPRLIFGERPNLRAPKWSPDGSRILFVRSDEFLDCYLLSDGRCMEAEWIRANKPFLILSELPRRKEPKHKLAMVNADGSGFRDLPALSTAQAPDWSGARIVYQSRAGLQTLAAAADEPGLNDLLYFDILKQYHQDPDWQPNEGMIVFQQREASHWELFAINADGSGRRALTRPATVLVDTLPNNVAPAWSPDGQWIAFLSNRTAANDAGPWRVWIMRADGSEQQPLAIDLPVEYGYANEQMLDWGP